MTIVLLAKIAMTALVVFLIMLWIYGFCEYQDPSKGRYKMKLPVFVPYVAGVAGVVMVVSVVGSILMALWS